VDEDVKDKIVDKIREEKYVDVYNKWIERHKKIFLFDMMIIFNEIR